MSFGNVQAGGSSTAMPAAIALALPIIKRFEGLAKVRADGLIEAYPDPAHGWKVPTIGWGCTGPDIERATVWTLEQCEKRLGEEAHQRYPALLRASAILAGDGPRGAAMLDFIFNLGTGAYSGSTLRRKVNEGEWEEAAAQCRRWVNAGGRKLPGLVLRREVEALMLERGLR